MAEIRMCDQKDCKQPAVLSYRWSWGEGGICCQDHGLLLQQTAQNLSSHDLKRSVSLASLENLQEPPLERSERTALIAAKLSAEAECAETLRRGGELYQQNVDLTGQVQVLTLRNREANAQLTVARATIETLEAQLHEREIELGSVTDELQRTQTLATFATSDTQVTGGAGKSKRKERGLTEGEG